MGDGPRRRASMLAALCVCGVFSLLATSCGPQDIVLDFRGGAGGSGGSGDDCTGACLPTPPPAHWKRRPVLMWVGDSGKAPSACPDNASAGTVLHAEPMAVGTCPLCTCTEPSCVLPVGLIASNTTMSCQGPNYTPFAAMPNGACSDNKTMPIPANGAASLALLAPTVSACTPVAHVPKDGTVSWNKIALVCDGEADGSCGAKEQCVPKASSDFMHCIENNTLGKEDRACPGEYPTQFVVYEEFNWTLACSPCACDPPAGGDCTANVSIYTDPSCNAASKFSSQSVPLGAPQCVTVPPNYAVAGMTASWITTNPGACLPAPNSGQFTGSVDVDHQTAHEFCCRPADGSL